jgi:hypothetical protein
MAKAAGSARLNLGDTITFSDDVRRGHSEAEDYWL